MSERPTNEEREALIANEHAGALEPDEAAELALLADLLADLSTWTEPGAGLEDTVVQAVVNAEPLDDTTATAGADDLRRSRKP
jgi:hypothetical protein